MQCLFNEIFQLSFVLNVPTTPNTVMFKYDIFDLLYVQQVILFQYNLNTFKWLFSPVDITIGCFALLTKIEKGHGASF